MLISEKEIKDLAAEHLKGSDKFLVDVNIKPGNKISVYIDGDQGVTISDCAKTSRFIEQHFDRDLINFELNVSSSGVTQPIKVLRQYKKYVGKDLQVLLNDGVKLTGKLLNYNEEGLEIESEKREKKSKQVTKQKQFIQFDNIKQTTGVISFK